MALTARQAVKSCVLCEGCKQLIVLPHFNECEEMLNFVTAHQQCAGQVQWFPEALFARVRSEGYGNVPMGTVN